MTSIAPPKQCWTGQCKHLYDWREGRGFSCEPYPEKIPDRIFINDENCEHFETWTPEELARIKAGAELEDEES